MEKMHADSDTLRPRRSPAKSRRNVVRKDQLLFKRNLYNWVVCLKILIRENLFKGKTENRDQITPSKSPQGHLAPNKNSGKKGPSQGIIQKCENHERGPCAQKIRRK